MKNVKSLLDAKSLIVSVFSEKANSEEPYQTDIDKMNLYARKDIVSSFDSNEEEGSIYTKYTKVSFPVLNLTFNGIQALQSLKLSFYEKYIILTLQKGICAKDINELIEKLSNILNFSKRCVLEFVKYLKNEDLLVYNKGNFKLDESVHFTLEKELNNAMFAEFSVKNADCDKIIAVQRLGEFYLDNDFLPNVFRRKGYDAFNGEKSIDFVQQFLWNLLGEKDEELKSLIIRSFENSNIHLKKGFTYNLNKEKINYFSFEFDALLEYKYVASQKKSILRKVSILKENFLPDNFILQLLEPAYFDNRLPRFVELRETFYNKATLELEKINEVEKKIEVDNDSIMPLSEEVETVNANLKALTKEYKANLKSKKESIELIEKTIKSKEKEINTNDSLIESYDDSNSELVKKLKLQIKSLMSEKADLDSQLKDAKKLIDKLDKEYSISKTELEDEISKKEKEIKSIKAAISKNEKEKKTVSTNFKELVSHSTGEIDLFVRSTVEKYPADRNILNRYINEICIGLDCAIAASEFEAFDDMFFSIDGIRERYRKAMHAIFDVTLKKSEQNLGSYFSNPYNIIAIDDMFRKRGIPLDIKNKMIIFHELANASGHSTENSSLKSENAKRINDYKSLCNTDRKKILLAIPCFFYSIELTNTEIKNINEKLKM